MRAYLLDNLKPVDYVVIFEEDTPLELIEAIKPDVLVKGADWDLERIVGADFVLSYGEGWKGYPSPLIYPPVR